MADIKISLRNTRCQTRKGEWIIPMIVYFIFKKIIVAFLFFYKDLPLEVGSTSLPVLKAVMHEADDVYSIGSTLSCYQLDQFLTLAHSTLILSKLSVLLDLSSILLFSLVSTFLYLWLLLCPRTLKTVYWS